jgi:hypothetical protein
MTMVAGTGNGRLCSYVVDVLLTVDYNNKYKETDARVVAGQYVIVATRIVRSATLVSTHEN